MRKLTPMLWFDGQAEEAAKFYASVFKKRAKVGKPMKGPDGKVLVMPVEIDGLEFSLLNGGPEFKFHESVSFVIHCRDQKEIDYYWDKLTADGGEESMCGWLKDKYGLSWQVTVLALVLLPIFVLPAKRMGRRLAALNREAADHNAAMGTQMTERFSAPGATLVKLFGRPADETHEFVARAARVRDIGVRTAMVQWVFVTALTLVSALALALVYGLGGWFALAGSLDPGDVVALALLLTRLYAPLTSLASARVEVMSALVSFARVFEVLPLLLERRAAAE